jgi:hypothetical protein
VATVTEIEFIKAMEKDLAGDAEVLELQSMCGPWD